MKTPDEPDIASYMAILRAQVRAHYRIHKHLEPRFYLWPPFGGEMAVMVPWEWSTFEEKHARRQRVQMTARQTGCLAVGVVSETWQMHVDLPPGLSAAEHEALVSKNYRDKMHLEPERQESVMIVLETRSAQLSSSALIIRKQPLNESSSVLHLEPWAELPLEMDGAVYTFHDKVKA